MVWVLRSGAEICVKISQHEGSARASRQHERECKGHDGVADSRVREENQALVHANKATKDANDTQVDVKERSERSNLALIDVNSARAGESDMLADVNNGVKETWRW